MYNRKAIDFDIEKYIATSTQFDHPGNHKRIHQALNAAIWELGQIRMKLLQEKQNTTLQYTLFRFNSILKLEHYLNELDLYLTSIGRKIKNLPAPKRKYKSTEFYGFKGKQGSISDAIRRLRDKIRGIKGILGGIKGDYQQQQNNLETFEMISQIDEINLSDTHFEQQRDIINVGIVLIYGILVLWKRKRGKKEK